jgi:hypothetical protein
MIARDVPGMVFFALTGKDDFVGRNRTKSDSKWFRQVLPAGPQIDLLLKEIPRYRKEHVFEPGESWSITLASTGFHFADEYGQGEIVRPVGFTPAFKHNTGWVDNLTIKRPRCILAAEKAAVPGQLPDEKPTVHAFLDGDFLRQNHAHLFGTFFRQITPLSRTFRN